MAIGSTLPPQAYTREMLSQAYSWMQGQPESIKKLATSPDMLVSLYLRHTRHGDTIGNGGNGGNSGSNLEAPISSQNFKSDLKTLAQDLRQFEEPNTPEPNFSPSLQDVLDGKSLKMIHEVKAALNLSSDAEACRALIALGFERMRSLFARSPGGSGN